MANKKIFLGMTVILLAFSFVLSCASTKTKDLGVYDPSVPESELCTLEIAGGIHVERFNGVKVKTIDDKWTLDRSLEGWGINGYDANRYGNRSEGVIRIPAGTHTLLCNFYIGNAERSMKALDMEITHTFVAGKTYRLKALLSYLSGGLLTRNRELLETEEYSLAQQGFQSVRLEIVEK